MFEILLNRGDGYAFIRWMGHYDIVIADHPGTPDRNDVRLILTEPHFVVFRNFLHRFGHRLENAEGILRGLGN